MDTEIEIFTRWASDEGIELTKDELQFAEELFDGRPVIGDEYPDVDVSRMVSVLNQYHQRGADVS